MPKALNSFYLQFCLALFLTIGVCAKENKASTTLPFNVEDCKLANSQEADYFFYHYQSKGKNIYLFGTIHVGKKSMYPLRKDIENGLKNSEQLVTEVILNNEAQMTIASFISKKGKNRPGVDTIKLLSPKAQKKLRELAKSEFGMKLYASMKPWLLNLQLMQMMINESSLSPSFGVEPHLTKIANQNQVKEAELETASEQMNMFIGLPNNLEMVDLTLCDWDNGILATDYLLKLWQLGDETKLNNFIRQNMIVGKDGQKAFDMMLTERNTKMTERIIEKYLSNDNKENIFIAVGSAHLVGEYGLPTLLKNKSYHFKKINAAKN